MFSFKVSEISKNTFFAEHLWTTGSAFSFSEAATGGALCKKAFLKISQNSQKYTFGLPNFQKHVFYRIPLDDCFWLFCAMLLKWGTANVWKTSDEYSLSRNTNLRSTVQVYHFFFRQDKLSVNVFIGLHCLTPEAAIKVEVFYNKVVLKDFVNFIGKHLCWSLFLIKLQARYLFWRTSTNDCFCTTLAPPIVTYPLYFIFSTFFLIITATTVSISDVCFFSSNSKGLNKRLYICCANGAEMSVLEDKKSSFL